jgi:hypothetical protein
MAKQKTKRCVMDTTATLTDKGAWEFDTGRFVWWFYDGQAGINLYVRDKDYPRDKDKDGADRVAPAIYAKTLDHAVMFGHGFNGGLAYALHIAKQ